MNHALALPGAVLAIGLASTALAAEHKADSSVAEGRKIALSVCWVCHEVGPGQPFRPMLDPPPPSFAEIANRPGVSTAKLRRFLDTTHWDEATIPMTMPSLGLTATQIDQLSRYILSQRRR